MQNIKQIVALDAFSVRLPTLRMEESLESCRLDGHILATLIHFGLYKSEILSRVVSIFEVKNMHSPMKKSPAKTNQI
jgi:hypothetical protein